MTFSRRLREERVAAGLSCAALSKLVGQSPCYVWDIEAGRSHPRIDQVERLASALGMSASSLCERPEFVDLEFAVRTTGPLDSPTFERSVLARVGATAATVGVWPWRDDGHLRLRALSTSVADVTRLSSMVIDGIDGPLGAPRAYPVEPTPDLEALIVPMSRSDARAAVLRRVTAVDCCPPLVLVRHPAGWLARVRAVPARCSVALQRLTPDAPFGLFVPA